ncbi:MAG TPA: hypothetical protein VF763_05610 [Candidatus Limnocylindrales bacterium]
MIRDVVVHIHNEQPLLADLYALPTASDACLVCTNLRTMNGKRPVFVDRAESLFLFPLGHIRFVEIPPASIDAHEAALPRSAAGAAADEGAVDLGVALAAAGEATGGVAEAGPELEDELEIDEDFLRRVRDI